MKGDGRGETSVDSFVMSLRRDTKYWNKGNGGGLEGGWIHSEHTVKICSDKIFYNKASCFWQLYHRYKKTSFELPFL